MVRNASLGHHVARLDVVEMNGAALALGAVVKLLMQIVRTRASNTRNKRSRNRQRRESVPSAAVEFRQPMKRIKTNHSDTMQRMRISTIPEARGQPRWERSRYTYHRLDILVAPTFPEKTQ